MRFKVTAKGLKRARSKRAAFVAFSALSLARSNEHSVLNHLSGFQRLGRTRQQIIAHFGGSRSGDVSATLRRLLEKGEVTRG